MENLSVQESLNVITSTIQKTKENMKEQIFYYLLWGWILVVASLSQYVIYRFTDFKANYLPWVVLIPLGIIATLVYARKDSRRKNYETYLGSFLKYLWIVLGASFIIVVFLSLKLGVNTNVFTLLLAGIGTLVSGLAMKFKPLIFGGLLFFAFSILALFVTASTSLLVFALACGTGYLLPAYLLKKS